MREPRRFLGDESGPELLEWVVVTLILILAFFAILQAFGDDLTGFWNTIKQIMAGLGR